jgi:hypothetical protein
MSFRKIAKDLKSKQTKTINYYTSGQVLKKNVKVLGMGCFSCIYEMG